MHPALSDPTGENLLANVTPTFSWVRIAIDTDHLPAGMALRPG